MVQQSLYSTREGFELYSYYIALKKHFTSTYDFFKYGGKMRLTVDSFERRKDKFFFYKLGKRKDCKEFLLANVIVDPDVWIGNLVDSKDADEIFREWTKRQQSLGYVFSNELDELNEDFNSNFVVVDGQYSRVLQLYNMKRLSIDTLIPVFKAPCQII